MTDDNVVKRVDERCWVQVEGFEPVGDRETFYIVDESEINVLENRIGQSSALAKTLIGAQVGDTVEYRPPGGPVELTVVDTGPL